MSTGSGQTLTITDQRAQLCRRGFAVRAGRHRGAAGRYTAGQGVTLGGGSGLSGSAPITAATLSFGAPTGGPIAIAGAFNLSTVTTLDLESGGAITETGAGAIGVATLTGSGTSVTLGGPNQIGSLGNFTANSFALSVVGILTLTGRARGSGRRLACRDRRHHATVRQRNDREPWRSGRVRHPEQHRQSDRHPGWLHHHG